MSLSHFPILLYQKKSATEYGSKEGGRGASRQDKGRGLYRTPVCGITHIMRFFRERRCYCDCLRDPEGINPARQGLRILSSCATISPGHYDVKIYRIRFVNSNNMFCYEEGIIKKTC